MTYIRTYGMAEPPVTATSAKPMTAVTTAGPIVDPVIDVSSDRVSDGEVTAQAR